ncbi:MAG: hypothetical protein AB8B79_16730 [Granulosicoccus sp.]
MNTICIVTALPAESRPFIDEFKLKHLDARGLRLYGNDDYLLLQTGVGKLKAAAATAALLHSRPEVQAIVNAGIAGGTADTGSIILGHHVVDTATGAQWFPHLAPQRVTSHLQSAAIHTVDKPCTEYRDGVVYDMEAAAIFSAASTYLTTDRMHCVKVVSDNPQEPVVSLQTNQVVEFMRNTVSTVSNLINWQLGNSGENPSIRIIASLCEKIESRVHHSVSEKHQLKRMLKQHWCMDGTVPELNTFDEFLSAREIKRHLQSVISKLPFSYGT